MSALVSYPDFTLTATLSGGSWASTYPLSNLKTRFLSQKARTTDDSLASATVLVDLGAPLDVRVLGILSHNISGLGTIRFRGYSDSGYTTLVTGADTGAVRAFPAYDATYDKNSIWLRADYYTCLQMALGTIPQDLAYDFNNDGVVNINDVIIALNYAQATGLDYCGQWKPNWLYSLTAAKTARFWKVEISDTSNLDAYIEFGRLWIGPASFAPAVDISYGATLVQESNDLIDTSLDGVMWANKRPSRRMATVDYNVLTAAEKQAALLMQRHLGLTGELVWMMDSAATARDMMMEAFLATIEKASPITYAYHNVHELPLVFREVL
ncbi:MAG: hypothetical protein HY888_05295 [Deltaproteobacteria bacterium]|nr:hypothetical protein [Deltaproteobacteria bacterium]